MGSRPVGASGGGAGTWGQGKEAGCLHNICLHPWKENSQNTNKNISRKQHPKKHPPCSYTANVPLPRGGPYPTVFLNIIEVFHCRRIRCLSFMINCLSFIVLYVFHSRE